MKKILLLSIVCMMILTSLGYAGGDKVCGENAEEPLGETVMVENPIPVRAPLAGWLDIPGDTGW